MIRPAKCVALALAASLITTTALAHPHVWVISSTDVLFDAQGHITALRQNWAFDDMYSAFAMQGMGEPGKPPSRETLAPLAKTNVESLAEFGYFTAARSSGKTLAFDEPRDYWLDADSKGIVSLHFTLPLKAPVDTRKPFSFQSYDPTYFVSFAVDKAKPVTLVDSPVGCSASLVEPAPLLASDQTKLNAAASDNFSPGADLSMRLAPRIVVACP